MDIDILQAYRTEPPPLDYALPNFLAGTVGALVSPGGTGKSMMALQIATTIAGGPDLLGLEDYGTGDVAYLPAEDPMIGIWHRLRALGKHLNEDQAETTAERIRIRLLIDETPNIVEQEWFDDLTRIAEGRRLLILDTLRMFHRGDENDSGAMTDVVGAMKRIASTTGCSILFLHHSSKSAALNGQGGEQQASRGSSVLVDNTRWQGFLAGMSSKEAEQQGVDESMRGLHIRFGVSKANYGPPMMDRWYTKNEGGVLLPAVLEPHRANRNDNGNDKHNGGADHGFGE